MRDYAETLTRSLESAREFAIRRKLYAVTPNALAYGAARRFTFRADAAERYALIADYRERFPSEYVATIRDSIAGGYSIDSERLHYVVRSLAYRAAMRDLIPEDI